ncbi:MAG: hypothetical protein QHH24_06140 [Candidatus Bathyarchaeota archaeon]|nr:hypothetical protein [Candidatus Bathyarchaeota archaeon]
MQALGWLLLPLFLTSLNPPFYTSSFCLTVETDKPHYLRMEKVHIYGRLTYNSWPVQSQGISLAVLNPLGQCIFIGTNQTDSDGCYRFTFVLAAEAEYGSYTARVNHQSVSNSTSFTVLVLSDVNCDGRVDLKDVALTTVAYGSYKDGPCWNACCDVNNDGLVDLKDVFIVCTNYGKP